MAKSGEYRIRNILHPNSKSNQELNGNEQGKQRTQTDRLNGNYSSRGNQQGTSRNTMVI